MTQERTGFLEDLSQRARPDYSGTLTPPKEGEMSRSSN
ncbi:hypothetical protein AVEN_142829-1, partial [Araneus ventricosus]